MSSLVSAVRVPIGPRVQPGVGVGAVSVAAAQRTEDHGAARHRAAVLDLQVDRVVVDLQSSCRDGREAGNLISVSSVH